MFDVVLFYILNIERMNWLFMFSSISFCEEYQDIQGIFEFQGIQVDI